jgi:hypothetical protein
MSTAGIVVRSSLNEPVELIEHTRNMLKKLVLLLAVVPLVAPQVGKLQRGSSDYRQQSCYLR